jgi:hypothetical protein
MKGIKMEKGMTIQDILDKLDNFRRMPGTDSVIIHTGGSHGLIELKEEFVNELKNDLQTKLRFAAMGIEELSATTKFAIYLLEDSY